MTDVASHASHVTNVGSHASHVTDVGSHASHVTDVGSHASHVTGMFPCRGAWLAEGPASSQVPGPVSGDGL